jgi:hypothetical protein
MLNFLLDGANAPFTIALGVMVGLGVLEIAALLIGFSLIPDGDADIDVDTEAGVLGWLGLGQTPLLVSLVLFLTAFGLVGLGVRLAVPVSPWLAAVPALVAGFATTKFVGGAIGRLLRKNETTAIAADELVGSAATIVLGETHRGQPSQAKLKDAHGQTHYVLVEPLRDEDTFGGGDNVLLVERVGPKFFVVGEGPDALDHLDARLSPQELSAEHRSKAH